MNGQEVDSFALVLRRLRIAAGMTQEALAERCGLGVRSIQGLERGESQPRRESIRRLTDALGLSPEQTAVLEQAGHPSPRQRSEDSASRPEVRSTPAAATASATPTRHNLPAALTSFVGRESELRALRDRLGAARLLTLTGTGGCGKTRLAVELAVGEVDAYTDGVWLVELAPLGDPGQVAQAVATALGVREVVGQPMGDTLVAALRERTLLLLIDNCEHLVQICAELADTLLRACPRLRILATSREPLGIPGEVAWRVPSLPVPPDGAGARPADLTRYEAIHLFVDRASATTPAFALTEQNAGAVAQICRRLDGIPLAIELGARRVATLSVEQIARRLDRRFGLLTGGSRVGLPRQQTLAATVDWSYNLLTSAERALFDRLAVFAGGFALEAVEAICETPTECALGDSALDLLGRLVEKSLVVADPGESGPERYRLLETLRQYARERLTSASALDEYQRRHALFYVNLAVEGSAQIMGAHQALWLDRLDREYQNVHAAMRWAIEAQQAEIALRIAGSLSYFWYFRGHHQEGRELRAAAQALPSGPELAGLRIDALEGEVMLALHQGDYSAARAGAEEALRLARRGDRRRLGLTLAALGFVARVQDDYAGARAALEEGIAAAREADEAYYLAMATHHLGLLTLEADRDLPAAWRLNEDALAIWRRTDNLRMTGVALLAMGRIARARGDLAEARALVAETVAVFQRVGDLGHLPMFVLVVAGIDADEGKLERAVTIASAASALDARSGTVVWPVIRRERDAWLDPARPSLGAARFDQAWAAGQALSRDEVISLALGRS